MDNNLNPAELKRLQSELHEFKKTFLYHHYRGCHKQLADETVFQILNEPLKGPETLYTREGWIGEARAAELQIEWFDVLELEINKEISELDP